MVITFKIKRYIYCNIEKFSQENITLKKFLLFKIFLGLYQILVTCYFAEFTFFWEV